MALTAVNPDVVSMPSPQGLELRSLLAEDSKTWKKGEFCFLTSGTVTPVVTTGKTDVYGIFAEDQATSTSTSTVKVRVLELGTELAMSVTNNGTAGASTDATIGTRYGAYGKSNVTYLDVNTGSGQFEVIGPLSTYDELDDNQFDMDAAPGRVLVKFTVVS